MLPCDEDTNDADDSITCTTYEHSYVLGRSFIHPSADSSESVVIYNIIDQLSVSVGRFIRIV